MRVIIGYEDKATIPGQYLMPESVKIEKEKIPIYGNNNDFSLPPLGFATDIRRGNDGELTAEIGDTAVPEGLSVTIYANQVVGRRKMRDDIMTWYIDSCVLQGLFFNGDLPWGLEPSDG